MVWDTIFFGILRVVVFSSLSSTWPEVRTGIRSKTLQNLRREIDLYDRRLSQRPWFIIANKMDLAGAAENLEALRKRFRSIEVVPVSARDGEGMDELKRKLEQWLLAEQGESEAAAASPGQPGISAET